MKNRFTSTIITILLTLLISACGAEDITTAADTSSDTATDTNVESDFNTDPVTNQVAMYSYNANLSDAQPLSNAVLEQTTVYMFFDNSPQYSSMNFYCCKGIDGASTGEAHTVPVLDSSAPVVYSADLSQYSTSGTRELYIDRIRIDGSGIDELYVNFSINISTSPIIPAPNTPAIISGVDRGSVTEDIDPDRDNLLEVTGKLNITDNDAGEAAFIARTVNGNYGSLIINTAGNWYYAANNTQTVIQSLTNGNTLRDRLTISSVDGTTHRIVITIIGADEANQPAVITGEDLGSVTEDVDPDGDDLLEVSGKLNITDNDAGEAAFTARTVNGNYGSLTINTAGNWNYAANNTQSVIQNLATGSSLSDTLTVRSVDGTTHAVRITINGADEVSSSADVSLSWVAPSEREDNTSISLSEIAGYTVRYGTTIGQYPNKVTINDGTAVGYTFSDFPAGTYHFVVTTIDTAGRESQHSSVATVIN